MDQTTAPGHTDSFAGTLLKRLRLNIRVLGLALRRRWLMPDDIGVSYDRLACGYDESWLIHLKTITDRLTARLNAPATSILDLGCGTGYTLAWATEHYPRALITGVDISRGMLDMATQRAGPPVSLVRADMLDYLHNCRSGSFDLIVAAWSIGYSNPAEVIAEAGRILPAGGTFAFVVNKYDTLAPVFSTYRRTMRRFPSMVTGVTIPRFPRSWRSMKRAMVRSAIRPRFHEESAHQVRSAPGSDLMPWLCGTGILAGFDALLDFDDRAVTQWFEADLRRNWRPLHHRYIMAIGEKQCCDS